MSSWVRGFLAFAIIGGVGAEVVHRSDRTTTTANEFDDVAIQAMAEPRVRDVSEIHSIHDMDKFLAESERKVAVGLSPRGASIKTDQAKTVVWSGHEFQTPLSLVYIHGFSASRLELDPVISDLAKELGANVFFTRLTAHGISDGEEFATVRARDWASDVDEAIAIGKKIGRRVVLMGMSTGAALALDGYHRALSREKLRSMPDSATGIAGLVLFSPNYALKDFGGFLLEGSAGPWMARHILGTHREFPVVNPMHGERWTAKYRTEGLAAMMTAVARVQQIDASKWLIPILTIYTAKDDVVSVDEIRNVSAKFHSSSELIDWPSGDRHQLSSAAFNSEASPELRGLVFEWIGRQALVPASDGQGAR